MKRFRYFISASFLSLVLGLLGIYYTLRSTRTHLTMDVAGESNVLDVRHPIPDLSIMFQGKDIEGERSNLRVLTIRIVNDGEVNIHENDYDSRRPFGGQIEGGLVYNDGALVLTGDELSGSAKDHAAAGQGARGGAIFNAGRLTITHSSLSSDQAVGGTGTAGEKPEAGGPASGGAIYNEGTSVVDRKSVV